MNIYIEENASTHSNQAARVRSKKTRASFVASMRLAVVLFFSGVMVVQAASLNLSGTFFVSDRSVPMGGAKGTFSVGIAVATSTVSVYSTTAATVNGTWSLTIPDGHSITAGTPITIFANDGVRKGALITKASSSADITGLDVYLDHVTIRNEAIGSSTKASDLIHYDGTDNSNIKFIATSTQDSLTITDSSQKLFVTASTTFIADLPILADDFEVATSAVLHASSTLTLTGDLIQNGTFSSAATTTWTARTAAQANSWNSITYGNGLFVAVAETGTNRVMTSPDGITWTARAAREANAWRSVTYGNSLFVAVADTGTNRVMTSPDGITWTARTAAEANTWRSITYGNDLFVAVADTGTNRVMTSPDGITWTARAAAEASQWLSVTYGNGLFVAVSYAGTNQVMTSPDGINWTARVAAESSIWTAITFGSGLFVAVSEDATNRVMTSPDGITWTARADIGYNAWYGITYGNGLFVAVSIDGTNRVMTSSETHPLFLTGTSTQILSGTMTGSSTLPAVVASGAGNKIFAQSASTTALTIASSSGVVIASSSLGVRGDILNATSAISVVDTLQLYGTNQIVERGWVGAPNVLLSGVGQKTIRSSVASTTDLMIGTGSVYAGPGNLEVRGNYNNNGTAGPLSVWSAHTPPANFWHSITYGNGLFVAVSAAGGVMTSPDGVTWTTRTPSEALAWYAVTYGNGLFVAVAGNGTNRVMTSPDGITWTSRADAENNIWLGVTYGNGLFVAVSSDGTNRVMTSPDGITWTARTAAENLQWRSVTYSDGLFVAAGLDGTNRVMTSPDGITWTARTVPDGAWISVTYGNGLFVAVANSGTNRVMTSPDGINWTARTVPETNQFRAVTYGDGVFVAVAETGTNRVMTSADGINWIFRQVVNDNLWIAIAYGGGTFAAVAFTGTNPAMTAEITSTYFRNTGAATAGGNMVGTNAFGNVFVDNTAEREFTSNASTSKLTIVSSSSSLRAPAQLSVRGDFENNGVLDNSLGTIALVGEEQQILQGNMTANAILTSPFHNLIVQNPAGVKPLDSVQVEADFTIRSGGVWFASSTLAVGGDFIQNGVFSAATSTAWTARTAAASNAWNSVTYGNGLFVAVAGDGANRVMTSPDGINWTSRTAAENNIWNSVTHGNGLFVAVAESGTNRVMTSPDGITWTARTATEANVWTAVTYGNGLFVAVSADGTNRVMTSSDGITWTARTAAAVNTWWSVTYGNGLFAAVSIDGDYRAMTSPDGITWTAHTIEPNGWLGAAFGDGTFVGVANSGVNRVLVSPDGLTGAHYQAAEVNSWSSITYGNGLFVAVSYDGTNRVMTSPDGVTWISERAAENNNWLSVTYGNGLFVAVASDGTNRVMTSPGDHPILFKGGSGLQTIDGNLNGVSKLPTLIFKNSAQKDIDNPASTTHLIVDSSSGSVTVNESLSLNGNYINYGGVVSLDTLILAAATNNQYATGTWTGEPSLILGGSGQKIIYTDVSVNTVTIASGTVFATPSEFIVMGSYTNNGISGPLSSWKSTQAAEESLWSSITYGNGLFVAVSYGGSNRIMTSPDGVVWTTRTAPEANIWFSVTYGNGLFVAVAQNGTNRVMTSPDGITWTVRTTSASQWVAVTYGNGLFVAVAASGANQVMTSPDGVNWTDRTAAGTNPWESITYGSGLFVAIAYTGTNQVMTSPDGINWTARTTPASGWLRVTYGNGLFVAVASFGSDRVMTSPDGINWTLYEAAAETQWTSVTYGNKRFVAVSLNGNSQVMVANFSTTTFAGNSAQTISGSLADENAFGNMVLTGNGAKTFTSVASTTNLKIETTATTTFSEALHVRESFAADPGSIIELAANATSSITDLSLSGIPSRGQGITLQSTVSSQVARLVLSGTVAVEHTSITDVSVCGSVGGVIDVSGADNVDGGNTTCWNFIASDPILDLGEDLHFYFKQATTTLGTITVRESEITPRINTIDDIRLTIATSTTNFRFDTSVTTLSYGGSAAGKVSTVVSYEDGGATLLIPVTSNFSASNTLSISGIVVGSFNTVSATTSPLTLTVGESLGNGPASFVSNKTAIITTLLTLEDHVSGQVNNAFTVGSSNNKTLLAFRLRPQYNLALEEIVELVTVQDVVVSLSGISGLDSSNLTQVRLFEDVNGNKAFDGGDVLIDGTGVITMNGQNGAITFNSDFTLDAIRDYIVVTDLVGIGRGDAVVVNILPSGINAIGATAAYRPVIISTLSAIQHERFGSGGGGGSAGRTDGDAPAGAGTVSGGGAGGGGSAGNPPDGENIAPDPNYKKPTLVDLFNNEWTNPSNALISDGVYATAASFGLRQTYTGFGFIIPTGDVITGISVKLDASGTTESGIIDVALSSDGGGNFTTAKATPIMTESDVVHVVGGATDLWGRSWTPGHFNNDNFIIRVTAETDANVIRLDALEIRVHHQATGGGSGGGGRT